MTANDVEMIETTMREASAAVERNDLAGLLSMFHDAPDTFIYDFSPPRRIDLDGLRASFTGMADAADGPLVCEVVEMQTHVLSDDIAWTAAVMHVAATMKDGSSLDLTYRATDLWRKIDERWVVIHEHASVPVNPVTGDADLASTP